MSLLLLFAGASSGGVAPSPPPPPHERSGHKPAGYDAAVEELLRRRSERKRTEVQQAKAAADASEAAAELHDRIRKAQEGQKVNTTALRDNAKRLSELIGLSGATYIQGEIDALNAAVTAARQKKNRDEQLALAARIAADIERQLLDEEETILILLLA